MNKIDLIYIVSGGLIKDSNGNWRTTNFDEAGDKSGVAGDRMRMVAGYYLNRDNPEADIIVAGGKGYQTIYPDVPQLSEVMKNELIELGVPEEKIIRNDNPNSTYEQLKELLVILSQADYKNISLVTNKFHFPRIEAMIENFEALQDLKKYNINFTVAEDVAIEHNSKKWKRIIDDAYDSPLMNKRIATERQGVEDIKAGKYKIV